MNKNHLLSPNFSRKFAHCEDNRDQLMNNQEDIFNIDVNSFINDHEDEEFTNIIITNSFSEGGDIFNNEELCQKLSCLYNQNFKCQASK